MLLDILFITPSAGCVLHFYFTYTVVQVESFLTEEAISRFSDQIYHA